MGKRAEMRRQQREEDKGKAVYNMSREQLNGTVKKAVQDMAKEAEKRIEEERKMAQAFAVETLIHAAALAMNDEFEFGTKRIQRFISRLEGLMQDFVGERLTLDDIKHWCEEKKIVIDMGKNGKEAQNGEKG